MASHAFARAKNFLNYNLVAKWTALLAGVGTGLLYVLFLFLLALFADVLVYQGSIPSLRHLPPHLRSQFLASLQQPLEQVWPERLKTAPGSEEVEDKIASIMTMPATQLTPDHVRRRKSWEEWWQKSWQERLEQLGFRKEGVADPEEQRMLTHLADLAATDDIVSLSPRDRALRREVLWRWAVFTYLHNRVSAAAAELISERTRGVVADVGPELALDRDIPDTGILSLVVRVQHRLDGWVSAWLAWLNPWMWASGITTYLVGLLLTAVLLALLRALLFFVQEYAAALATTEATTRLRRAVYHHTYRLGTLVFRALGPSEAVSIFTRHLEALHDGFYGWLTVYFREPVKFALLFLFALMVNVWLALAFLMFALLVWMIGGQIAAHFRHRGRQASQNAAEQLALLQESLKMMRLVKVYLMELFNQNRVERQLSRYARLQLRRMRSEAIYTPLLVFLGMVAALLLLFVIGIAVANGQLSVAGAIVLTTALVSLYLPFQTWLEQRRFLRRARDSASALFEFLDRPGSVGQVVEAEFLPPLAEQLEFDNVSIKEPGSGRRLLKDVSFTIKAGERVALVGPDDMEKHALIYLIPRFLDPSSGEIRIDGKNLRWTTLDSLRAQISIVMQHSLVFNDSVANNIGCGDKSNTLPQIIEVAKLAHAHQFIQKLPKGYETPIGEMGHTLSISQQFRIALARAILRDPALIIIEEPLVPLDEEVKDLLDDTMTRVLPGRTVIFLPHRLSTIRHCDQVFLLHEGKIVASGDHKGLLGSSELYRHVQYLEFNEFAGVIKPPAPVTKAL